MPTPDEPPHPDTCPQIRYPTLAAAQVALVTRRARAALARSPLPVRRVAYRCRRCGGAHITRNTPSGGST